MLAVGTGRRFSGGEGIEALSGIFGGWEARGRTVGGWRGRRACDEVHN